MLAPDFYVQFPDRRATREQFIDNISSAMPGMELKRFDMRVLTVQPSPSGGWSAVIEENLESERIGPDGSRVRSRSVWVTKDGWRETDGEWQLTSSEVVGVQMWPGVRTAEPSGGGRNRRELAPGQRPPFMTVVEGLLEAIADPTEDRFRDFAEAHLTSAYIASLPIERHLEQLTELRTQLGRAEIVNLIAERPGERQAFVRSGTNGKIYSMRLGISTDMPPKISGIALEGEAPEDAAAGPGGAPAPPLTSLTPLARREILDRLYEQVERRYVSSDTARLITAHLRVRDAAGAYDPITDPAELGRALTADPRAVNEDLHLRVVPGGLGQGAQPTADAPPGDTRYGFSRVERLPGNIGLIAVRGLLGGADEAFDVATEALRSLEGTEALILDLRDNNGAQSSPRGSILLHLLSHFLTPEAHILESYDRVRAEATPIYTLAKVPGPRRLQVPIYVLTNRRTASGGEYLAFVLQAQGRATVIGEETAGAGRMVTAVPLAHGFTAGISVTRITDPRTGRGWEIVGVQPDVEVPPSEAMETALELIRGPNGETAGEAPEASARATTSRWRAGMANGGSSICCGRLSNPLRIHGKMPILRERSRASCLHRSRPCFEVRPGHAGQ